MVKVLYFVDTENSNLNDVVLKYEDGAIQLLWEHSFLLKMAEPHKERYEIHKVNYEEYFDSFDDIYYNEIYKNETLLKEFDKIWHTTMFNVL